jgi:long-chain acyl-CoA synthetase
MGSIEFQTLNELFLKAVEKYDKPDCFLSKSEGRYQGLASSEALRRVAGLASVFARLGVGRGDRVAILSENRVEWSLTDYALLGLGAIPVPLYPTLLEPDIEFILRDSGSKGIVVSTDIQLRKVLNVRSRLPQLGFMLAADCSSGAGTGTECWEGVVESEWIYGRNLTESFRAKALSVKPEETASIIYTSGTAGQPKGVILTHANLVSNIHSCEQLFDFNVLDVGLSFLPLSHVFERMVDYFYMSKGVSIAYAESLERLPRNLLEVRPTVMMVVPRILEKIREKVMDAVQVAPAAKQRLFNWALDVGRRSFAYDLDGRLPPRGLRMQRALADKLIYSKVRQQLGGRIKLMISGAAPLAREVVEFFFSIGLPVYEGYGMTETSPVMAVNYPGHTKLSTVGRVIPSVEVKLSEEVVDDGPGIGREILVRGPNVTSGYYRLEEENRRSFVDGWFCTGDLGALDEDGYLSITGRKKNLFKTSGGKYVAPEKLENLFQGHPYVRQIMVLGSGRRFVGALVVPNFDRLEEYARKRGIEFKGRKDLVAIPAILNFIQQQVNDATRWLAPHERIRQIVLLPEDFTTDSGELSSTLKIKRYVVEERYREQIEEMFSRKAPHAPAVSAAAR